MSDTTTNGDAAMPELNPAQKQALFVALEKAQADAANAAKALEAAQSKVSAACAEIAAKLGKGSYVWKGKTYQLVKSRGGESLTLRQAKSRAQEIG